MRGRAHMIQGLEGFIRTAEERGADSNSRGISHITIIYYLRVGITKFGWEHVYFPDLVYDARHFETSRYCPCPKCHENP